MCVCGGGVEGEGGGKRWRQGGGGEFRRIHLRASQRRQQHTANLKQAVNKQAGIPGGCNPLGDKVKQPHRLSAASRLCEPILNVACKKKKKGKNYGASRVHKAGSPLLCHR